MLTHAQDTPALHMQHVHMRHPGHFHFTVPDARLGYYVAEHDDGEMLRPDVVPRPAPVVLLVADKTVAVVGTGRGTGGASPPLVPARRLNLGLHVFPGLHHQVPAGRVVPPELLHNAPLLEILGRLRTLGLDRPHRVVAVVEA